MEPHQARLTALAFVALSVLIVFNALFMQSDPGFAIRSGVDGVGSAPVVHKPSASRQRLELVQAVKRELRERKYFPGKTDGSADAMLAGAIMAYEFDRQLPLTGKATDQLLKSFLFGIETGKGRAAARNTLGETAERLVAEVQGILSGHGYYIGSIDGRHSEATAAAVRSFETERGLPVTGRVSGLLVQEISRVTGMRFTAPRS